MLRGIGLLALSAALWGSAAGAAVIDFAGYAAGTRIRGPLAIGAATFQASGDWLLIDDFGTGKAICPSNGLGCAGSLSIFFEPGATGLGIDISGDMVAGSQTVFGGESDVLAFRGVIRADGDPTTAERIALRFENVLLISLASNDPGRVGFGNIRFNEAAAVPEPGSWALMLAGLGATGAMLRGWRRRVTWA